MKAQPRIMLVEDDATLQRMYDRAFTNAGYDVALSPDGTIVYEISLQNPPDIIVMDVMMPNYDGLLALKELKSNMSTRGIPVIMLSGNTDQTVIDKALQLGARHYLIKSDYDLPEIINILNQTLAESQQRISKLTKHS